MAKEPRPEEAKKEEPKQEPQVTPGIPATVPPGSAPAPKQYVQVPLEEFNAMKAKLETVYQATDKGRLAAIEGRSQKKIPTVVRLSTLERDGVRRIVVAWRTVKDDVFKASNGAWVENQIVEAIFEDNTKIELPLVDFYRKTAIERIEARVVSRTRDSETEAETFTVALPDGRQMVIGGTFVN